MMLLFLVSCCFLFICFGEVIFSSCEVFVCFGFVDFEYCIVGNVIVDVLVFGMFE